MITTLVDLSAQNPRVAAVVVWLVFTSRPVASAGLPDAVGHFAAVKHYFRAADITLGSNAEMAAEEDTAEVDSYRATRIKTVAEINGCAGGRMMLETVAYWGLDGVLDGTVRVQVGRGHGLCTTPSKITGVPEYVLRVCPALGVVA